jgi:hypothetical protein
VVSLEQVMVSLLNNASVAAFLGAASAFGLVVANDYRRRLKSKRQIRYLVSDNLDLAHAKLETVKTNIAMLTEDNRLSGAPIMTFPTAALKSKQLEVIDLLDANQSQGLSVLLYWMEGIDGLLSEYVEVTKRLRALPKAGPESAQRIELATQILSTLTDAQVSLERLIEMCEWYGAGQIYKIFETEVPIR